MIRAVAPYVGKVDVGESSGAVIAPDQLNVIVVVSFGRGSTFLSS